MKRGHALLLAAAPQKSAYTLEHTFQWSDRSTMPAADTGQAATAHAGTWGISAQRASLVVRSADSSVTWDCGKSDLDMTCDILWVTGAQPGIILRGVDGENYLLLHVSGTTLQFFRKVTGSFTGLTTSPGSVPFVVTNGVWYRFRVVASGTSFSVYGWARDTASQPASPNFTATSAQFQTATRVGLRLNDATAPKWQNLRVA